MQKSTLDWLMTPAFFSGNKILTNRIAFRGFKEDVINPKMPILLKYVFVALYSLSTWSYSVWLQNVLLLLFF